MKTRQRYKMKKRETETETGNETGTGTVGGNIYPTPATACVGIKESEGPEGAEKRDAPFIIPPDTFAKAVAGDKIFLIHCPLLEYASLTAEIHGFDPLFREYRGMDLQSLKSLKVLKTLRDFLLDWVREAEPFLKATRMVEAGGVLPTLFKMLLSCANPQVHLGVALNSFSGKQEEGGISPFQEVLYQVLCIVNKKEEQNFLNKFNNLMEKHQADFLELKEVGTCLSSPEMLFEGRSRKLADLKYFYQQAWKKHFPF